MRICVSYSSVKDVKRISIILSIEYFYYFMYIQGIYANQFNVVLNFLFIVGVDQFMKAAIYVLYRSMQMEPSS